jgi:hypothetical protein
LNGIKRRCDRAINCDSKLANFREKGVRGGGGEGN